MLVSEQLQQCCSGSSLTPVCWPMLHCFEDPDSNFCLACTCCYLWAASTALQWSSLTPVCWPMLHCFGNLGFVFCPASTCCHLWAASDVSPALCLASYCSPSVDSFAHHFSVAWTVKSSPNAALLEHDTCYMLYLATSAAVCFPGRMCSDISLRLLAGSAGLEHR